MALYFCCVPVSGNLLRTESWFAGAGDGFEGSQKESGFSEEDKQGCACAGAQGQLNIEPPPYCQTRDCRICLQFPTQRLRHMFRISVLSSNRKPPSAIGICLLIP